MIRFRTAMLVEPLLNIFCRLCTRWKPQPDSDGHDVSPWVETSKWTQLPLENSGSARQTRGSRMTFIVSQPKRNAYEFQFQTLQFFGSMKRGGQAVSRELIALEPCQTFMLDGSMNGENVWNPIGTTYRPIDKIKINLLNENINKTYLCASWWKLLFSNFGFTKILTELQVALPGVPPPTESLAPPILN